MVFETINKIDKLFARPMKKYKRKDVKYKKKITKIRTERWLITTARTDIERIVRKYYEPFYANNLTSWMKWTNSLREITTFSSVLHW